VDPGLEDAWLILASLAHPRASIAYYEKALRVNPQSAKARKGLHEAIVLLRKEIKPKRLNIPKTRKDRESEISSSSQTGEGKNVKITAGKYSEPITQPNKTIRHQGISLVPATQKHPISFRPLSKNHWSIFTITVIIFCVGILWAFWPGGAVNVMAYLNRPTSTMEIPGEILVVSKPTYTSTFTPTFTPTATFTSTPTPTDTPTPTLTNTPTSTLVPTETFIPVATKPQDEFPGDDGNRWIDVDLSDQMLYAYEGNVIVASFLVSTGVPAFPTVTGQYHIYVKYYSTLMSGPGYYLPNVPYTMYFYRGYGIHGTYWHNNFGHPMSHGCVNMYTPNAEWMYYWASVGTLVNVHY
jgi:lipoprotein-anchoring transpeptidase ErfK/SrfK